MKLQNPFDHVVLLRSMAFVASALAGDFSKQELYPEITKNAARNEQISAEVIASIKAGRPPLPLPLDWASGASGTPGRLCVGLGRALAAYPTVGAIPDSESRVIFATGSYISEGLDDSRLDTLFPAVPIS